MMRSYASNTNYVYTWQDSKFCLNFSRLSPITPLIYYYEKLLHQKNKWPATTAYILWFALSMRIMNDTRNREKPVVFDTNYTHSCLVHDEMLNDERTVHSSYLVSCDDNSKVSFSHFLALTPYLYDYTRPIFYITTCIYYRLIPR
jgi:hypothetical protein